LADDPDNPFAREAIERSYVQQNAWPKLLAFYQADVQRFLRKKPAGFEGEVVSCWFKMATLYKDKLALPFEAMETYENILRAAPNNLQVRNLMEELRSQKALWQQWADASLENAGKTSVADAKLVQLKKAAKILLTYLHDKTRATPVYLQ